MSPPADLETLPPAELKVLVLARLKGMPPGPTLKPSSMENATQAKPEGAGTSQRNDGKSTA